MGAVTVLRPRSNERALTLSNLPPLTALRAFVVTARHLSFAAASSELHVTSAAVGHQIRQLEAYFGRPLFERTGRQLLLTSAGETLLPALAGAFEQTLAAVSLLLDDDRDPLSISVAPSFASKWLIPRLDRFRELHPDLEIRVDASPTLTDFATGDVDCAIRYGAGDYPGLVVEKLLAEAVFPVASPLLLKGRYPLRTQEDLRHHVFLHDDSPDVDASCPDWTTWLRASGLNIKPAGPRFNQSALVLEAAAAGQGVALAKSRLAEADLRSGRLVRPFGAAQKVELFYFFVAPAHKTRLRRVRVFYEWLVKESSEDERLDDSGNPDDGGPAVAVA